MSQDTNLSLPADLHGDAPLPFVMPPPGSVVQWHLSPADLLDWSDAKTRGPGQGASRTLAAAACPHPRLNPPAPRPTLWA